MFYSFDKCLLTVMYKSRLNGFYTMLATVIQ